MCEVTIFDTAFFKSVKRKKNVCDKLCTSVFMTNKQIKTVQLCRATSLTHGINRKVWLDPLELHQHINHSFISLTGYSLFTFTQL